ncbi:MAG: agmatinase family protein [Candidatus Egerieousia sp.]
MAEFDVNGVGVPNGKYFGMPFDSDECPVALISVPWDATVSYAAGTAKGPDAIIDASIQVDLFDEYIQGAEELKIGTDEALVKIENGSAVKVSDHIGKINVGARAAAERIIGALASGRALSQSELEDQEAVNRMSREVNRLVEGTCLSYYKKGIIPGVVGGEHSVAFGAVKAAASQLKRGETLGLIQFDAHADLRVAYEGFEYSHASVMYNCLSQIPEIETLCQISIRDFCVDEYNLIKNNKKIKAFTGGRIADALFNGKSWNTLCSEVIESLPEKVYISFDIDGLEPSMCPHTGTPVPGGITFDMAVYLLRRLAKERKIVGFDLCEVAPGDDEWDANVGARLLHKLCLFTATGR